jgi:hypothetical protein
MRDRREIESIKALLQARISSLVAELVPDGKLVNGYWMGTNPARTDTRAGSFWIIVSRPGKTPGAWRDEAVDNLRGDVIGLIAMICCNGQPGPAIAWAKKWLNYEALPQTQVNRARLDALANQKKDDELRARKLEEDQRRAFAVFLDSKYIDSEHKKPRDFASSLAGKYLRGRGLDLSLLERVPGALGFLPHAKHIANDRVETYWPAMVAGMSDAGGHIKAVHRTFLKADGSGKAPVDPVRKIWPTYAGLAIRLWRGETGVSPSEAAKQGLLDTLVLCEGVEDGLSIALARPDYRVWCAASLANLANIQIPVCCEKVIVAADNDWGKPGAEAALKRALGELARQGRPVFVARSPIGKDMNDLIRGAA